MCLLPIPYVKAKMVPDYVKQARKAFFKVILVKEKDYNKSELGNSDIIRRMDKEDMIHIYNGILLSHEKEQNNAICSNMDGSRDCHTE